MVKYNYYPMHMHLHSCHQPGASMEGHIFNAHNLGMKYIRFTDHDTRTGRKKHHVDSFDFAKGAISYEDYHGYDVGWKAFGNPTINFDNSSMILSSMSNETCGVELYSSGRRHSVSLLASLSINLGAHAVIPDGARALIDIRLSQRPPEHKPAHYRYVFGKANSGVSEHIKEKEMSISENGVYKLNVSDDVGSTPEIGGLDNAFDTISIILEGVGARIAINKLEFEVLDHFDDVIKKQRMLAAEIGKKYGVKPFVTTEISGAGLHKNVFSEKVPVIDYREYSYKMDDMDAIAHVRNYGGTFSYNHPLEKSEYKRREFTKEEMDFILSREISTLTASRALGADAMEVGFVEGRGRFTMEDHLRLWDMLSMSGVFITGYGDSDSHYNDKGWLSGNNFATWIAADSRLDFPIGEEVFNDSVKAGRVYMGDPVYLRDSIYFRCNGEEMGSVMLRNTTHTCEFGMSNASVGWVICAMVNGELHKTWTVEEQGKVEVTFEVDIKHPVNLARVEVYNEKGRCILLTNPIYFVNQKTFVGEIPAERICPDKAVITEYNGDIDLPYEIFSLRSQRILHIGDTHTRDYAHYIKLVEKTKPDVIIHTGDMADEVKVGRIPGTRNEYISKIKLLLEVLGNSGARVIIVPGNNDLPDVIRRLLSTAEVYPVNSIVKIDGVECRVGHQVSRMTYDKRWSFYGHGFTGEDWEYSRNDPENECRFNAAECSYVCSVREGLFWDIPDPKTR